MTDVKSMLEKLTERYLWLDKYGIPKHTVVYGREISEIIKSNYEFEKGTFTLKEKSGDYFIWIYHENGKRN